MKIIPLIDEIYNKYCNAFQKSLTPLNIESNIRDVGDNFTIKLYRNNEYEEINIKINKICNIKYDQRLSRNHSLEYKINTNIPVLDTPEENNRLRELLAIRQEVYTI